MKRHYQPDLIDTTPLGLSGGPAEPAGNYAAEYNTVAPKPPETTQNCLHCGKPSVGMFCNAKCRTRWTAGMNSWQNKMAKTAIKGEQELF